MYVHVCMQSQLMIKEAMTSKERGEMFMGEREAWMKERKWKMLELYYIIKNSNKQSIYSWPTV